MPRSMLKWGMGLGFILLLVWGGLQVASPPDRGEVRATLSAAEALAGGDTEGYARAVEPRPFVFPDDHGPHPGYRTEWWYLTGHLDGEGGERFGFQLTFFRNSLAPEAPETPETPEAPEAAAALAGGEATGAEGTPSAWATTQLWMAHLALTDVTSGEHQYEERFARGAVGLAGAAADPFRVWLEDWALERDPAAAPVEGSGSAFPFALRAAFDGGDGLALRVEEGKPPVLQGDAGLSQKGPEPGNASYYLSWTRMPLAGEVVVDGRTVRVTGEGWMDREWSTSALGEVHTGWDWFSLQLDDGRELMFFELRRADGARDPLNHGALVEADGRYRAVDAAEVELEVLDAWASPVDGTVYPSGWRLRIPEEALDLVLTPRVRDQEMNVTFRYWEGALEVSGTSAGSPVGGRGYAELTGYAASENRPPS